MIRNTAHRAASFKMRIRRRHFLAMLASAAYAAPILLTVNKVEAGYYSRPSSPKRPPHPTRPTRPSRPSTPSWPSRPSRPSHPSWPSRPHRRW